MGRPNGVNLRKSRIQISPDLFLKNIKKIISVSFEGFQQAFHDISVFYRSSYEFMNLKLTLWWKSNLPIATLKRWPADM